MVYLVIALLVIIVVGMCTGKPFKFNITVQKQEDPKVLEYLQQRQKLEEKDVEEQKQIRAGMQDALAKVQDVFGIEVDGGNDDV